MTAYDHGGDVFAVARQLGVTPEELLDFSASINPLGMPDGVRTAIASEIGRLVHYPDPDAQPLREALAAYHGVAPEQICPANGTTELIYLLPRLAAGKRALVLAPAFSEYAKALVAAGWEVQYHCLAPDDGFALDPARIGERLAEGYQLLFFANPGNPSGRLYHRCEVDELAGLCRRHGVMLVLDEAFIDFCGEEASAGGAVAAEGGVVLRSLTKFYAIPGLRLGYAIAGAALCQLLAALRGPWSVNTLAQAAGLAALSDMEFRARTREAITLERGRLVAMLAAIPGLAVFPGAANYLLVRLSDGHVAAELRSELLRRRILIRDCGTFTGLDGGFIRLAVRSQAENDRLASALAEIRASAQGRGRAG